MEKDTKEGNDSNECPQRKKGHHTDSVDTDPPHKFSYRRSEGPSYPQLWAVMTIIITITIIQQLCVTGLKTRSASALMSKNIEHTCTVVEKQKQINTKMHIVTSLEFRDD